MPAAAGEASAAAREAAATQNLLRDLGVAAGGETASKPPRAPMTEAEAALVIQRQLRMRTAKRHVRARAKRKAVRDAILAVEAETHHQPPRRRRHGAAQASGGEAPKHDARRRRHARGATEAAEGQQAGAEHGAAGAWESEQACAALRVRHAAAEAEVAALRGATEERQAEERDGAVARRRAQREQAKAQRGAAGEWEAARAEAAAVERACAALRVRHAAVSERAEAEREAATRRGSWRRRARRQKSPSRRARRCGCGMRRQRRRWRRCAGQWTGSGDSRGQSTWRTRRRQITGRPRRRPRSSGGASTLWCWPTSRRGPRRGPWSTRRRCSACRPTWSGARTPPRAACGCSSGARNETGGCGETSTRTRWGRCRSRLALPFRRPSDASLPPGRCIAAGKQPSPRWRPSIYNGRPFEIPNTRV